MIKTNLKYSDGSIKYWHTCKSCGYEKAYIGTINKSSLICSKCNPKLKTDKLRKAFEDTVSNLKLLTEGVTKDSLNEIFEYLPEGILVYKISLGSKALKGMVAGTLSKKGYRVVSLNNIQYQLPYLIWVFHYGEPLDTISRLNKVPWDTRVENLSLGRSRKTNDQFILDACKIHSYKYDYSKTEYIHNKGVVTITCKEHGNFEQEAHSHLNGCGCPKCAKTGFKQDRPATLYYLRVNSHGLYKIGITNNSVKDRYLKQELENITVIREWEYATGVEAFNEEQLILKEFKTLQYKGDPVLSTGNSELFVVDVLQLDSPTI